MNRFLTSLITCLFIVGCTSSSIAPAPTSTSAPTALPTNTPTPTPEPTPTPTPIDGLLFFDMNGSGLKDEASFQYDAARLTDERQPLQADLLAAINAYLVEHPDIKDGDLVTLVEPGLSGYTVCAGSNCVTTDAEGRFQLVVPEVSRSLSVTIQDPNAGTPALEMKYINKWKRAVTVAEYTKDTDISTMGQLKAVPECETDAAAQVCKQDEDTLLVREQHLNDTSIFELADGAELMPGNPKEIGLMQGFLTLPYRAEDADPISALQGRDHDPREGYVINYEGDTSLCPYPPNCQKGTWDSHGGIDYGMPRGTILIASAPGILETWTNTSTNGSINLWIKPGSPFNENDASVYGHLAAVLVNQQQKIYRSQIVALSGNSGTNWNHLDFSLILGPVHPERPDGAITSYTDPYGVLPPISVIFDAERTSAWTSFNIPIYK